MVCLVHKMYASPSIPEFSVLVTLWPTLLMIKWSCSSNVGFKFTYLCICHQATKQEPPAHWEISQHPTRWCLGAKKPWGEGREASQPPIGTELDIVRFPKGQEFLLLSHDAYIYWLEMSNVWKQGETTARNSWNRWTSDAMYSVTVQWRTHAMMTLIMMYSQTCLQPPPLAVKKGGPCRQVAAL